MNLPPIPPAFVSPDVLASWENKTRGAILKRIARGEIPPHCVLRPTTDGKTIIIDVAALLEYLRRKNTKIEAPVAVKDPA